MKIWKLASAVTALVLSINVNAASIVGQTMTAELGIGAGTSPSILSTVYDTETFVVIEPGQEIDGGNQFHGVYETYGYVDVSSDSITIHGLSIAFTDNGYFNGYRFYDTYGLIDDFTSAIVTSKGKFDQSRLSFDEDNIWLNMAGLNASGKNGSITLDFTSASIVPVPAAVWLFGSGLIGLMGVARRK